MTSSDTIARRIAWTVAALYSQGGKINEFKFASTHIKALKKYNSELVKFNNLAPENDALVTSTREVMALTQCTAFESQICRSLAKKDKDAKVLAIKKYLVLFASVPSASVLPQLWNEAQKMK